MDISDFLLLASGGAAIATVLLESNSTTAIALKIGVSVMLIGTVVFLCFPTIFMRIYAAKAELLSIGAVGLRILTT